MLGSTLSVQVPHLPVFWDRFAPPVVDFWEGLAEEAWQIFSNPANFGHKWQNIRCMREEPARLVSNGKLLGGHFPCQTSRGPKLYELGGAMDAELAHGAAHFANEAVNPKAPVLKRQLLSRYLERFAFFFQAELFVRRCFEALLAEQRPELVGAAEAMKELFEEYRSVKHLPEESLVEHCYKDDMYLELDLSATSCFMYWLGVIVSPGEEEA
ncbi:unnamed protein product [Durusdinium trenchii]